MRTRARSSATASARYEEALAAAASASEHREVVAENWGLSELVEPATRCGRTDLATDALERLATKAQATRTDWALGIEARARALLGEGADAERWFRTAIEHLGRTRVRAELARTHLLYGEWLRRESRRLDARAELNVAHELFTSMGMQAFAERAGSELLATGEKARRRIAETRDDLTAQERQIAAARPRRALERRDRCPPVPQPTHRRVAPAPRVRQARDPLPTPAGRRPRRHSSSPCPPGVAHVPTGIVRARVLRRRVTVARTPSTPRQRPEEETCPRSIPQGHDPPPSSRGAVQ